MKLALLGLDAISIALAQAAIETGTHTIDFVADSDANQRNNSQASIGSPSVEQILNAGTQSVPWEALLDGDLRSRDFDAAIVGRGNDPAARMDQLRKLVQAGVPMLVVHPVLDSMLLYYELEMIRAESGCIMVPFLPLQWHPAAEKLRSMLTQAEAASGSSPTSVDVLRSTENQPLGQVDQVVFERAMHDRSRTAVVAQFACDVDLIRAVCGDVTRLGAMGSPGKNLAGEHLAYNNLGVQLTGDGSLLTRWIVGPVDQIEGGRLIATGTQGKAIWHLPNDSSDWSLDTYIDGQSTTESFKGWNPYVKGIERLEQAIRSQQLQSPTASAPTGLATEGRAIEPSWNDAARSIELAETIDRSLTKNRSIELHQEEFSDIGTFKGFMTSIGCALLLIGLVVMVGGAVVAKLLKAAGWLAAAELVGWIPYLMLAVFGVFLLLQLILKIATSGPTESAASNRV